MKTPRTNRAEYNGPKYLRDECALLETENIQLRALLAAVSSSEFGGTQCNDINDKNWFDERQRLLDEYGPF